MLNGSSTFDNSAQFVASDLQTQNPKKTTSTVESLKSELKAARSNKYQLNVPGVEETKTTGLSQGRRGRNLSKGSKDRL